jgi:hypothetical protein
MNARYVSKQRRDATAIRFCSTAARLLGALLGFMVFADPFVNNLATPRVPTPSFVALFYATVHGVAIFAVGLFLGGVLRGFASIIELLDSRADESKTP